MTPRLVVEGLGHAYDGRPVLADIALAVAPGEVLCLLGPSGCGKSTLLRLIAGLERVQRGRIAIDGQVVAGPQVHLPPEHRAVGLVFQDFALFPHLSVRENVGFGLFRAAPAVRQARALEVLAMLGMADRADAFPHMLSGGQQQRVALARALAPAPRVLLLDEPFSGLDVTLRARLREETRDVLERSGTAAVLVTHDPEEAMVLADRIAVMNAGRVLQVGPPADLYDHPADAFVATLFGEVNRLPGRVQGGHVLTALGRVVSPAGFGEGDAVTVLVRPEGLRLGEDDGVQARVISARLLGADALIRLVLGDGTELHARISGHDLPGVGQPVRVTVVAARAFVFPTTA